MLHGEGKWHAPRARIWPSRRSALSSVLAIPRVGPGAISRTSPIRSKLTMTYMGAIRRVAFVGCALWFGITPALAQTQTQPGPSGPQTPQDQVEVIMSPRESGAPSRVRDFFRSMKRRIAAVTGQVLPFTKCEKWSGPKANLEAVKKEAAKRGVVVTELGADWNHVMRSAPADTQLNEKQRAMMELAKAGKATAGVKLMAAPPPAVLEHALMKDANNPAAPRDVGKITVALGDNRSKTIIRTSVDIKPDMCIWRGTVEETGALVTLMWWPNGRMAGMVQERDRIYSIRHMGGPIYALIELGGDRMPQEHAPMPVRLRSDDPNARDDPLVNQGDASLLRPVTLGMRAPAATGPKQQQEQAVAPPVASGAADVVIDVIIAYTAKAAANYTDIKTELVDLSIEESNESFRMSGLGNIKLRLVNAYQTSYVEEGSHFDHVWRFADKGDGYMEEIHGLRDKQ